MTAKLGSSLYASAGGDRVKVILGLEPAFPTAHAVGPAYTVQSAAGDNLSLHHALALAEPGDVIVLAVGGEQQIAHVGEIVAIAAAHRGLAGIVLDGATRDRAELARFGFPIFGLGASPRGPGKAGPGAVAVPVELGGVAVASGDLVCADADGVVVIAAAHAEEVQAAAAALEARERAMIVEIRGGRTTVDVLGLKELT